jgi:hypothetical protein
MCYLSLLALYSAQKTALLGYLWGSCARISCLPSHPGDIWRQIPGETGRLPLKKRVAKRMPGGRPPGVVFTLRRSMYSPPTSGPFVALDGENRGYWMG